MSAAAGDAGAAIREYARAASREGFTRGVADALPTARDRLVLILRYAPSRLPHARCWAWQEGAFYR